MRQLLLASALLVVGCLAVPVKRNADAGLCASKCTGAENRYAYAAGKTYKYTMSSTTDIQAAGSDNDKQSVSQTAEFNLAVSGPCEFSLQITSIAVAGASVPDSFAADVTRHPLRFSFDDGRVGEICPLDDDPIWVLNIKRAVISTLQNAFDEADENVHETDVSGKCRTTYTQNGDSYVSEKNLASCQGHHGLHGAVRATSFDTNSGVSSSPFTERSQTCTHTLSNGHLSKATCTESHKFKAFTDKEDGLVASSTTITIESKGESDGVDASAFPSVIDRHSLEFDHRETLTSVSADAKSNAEALLTSLCEGGDAVQKQTATEFVDLVHVIRRMDQSTIEEVMSNAESHACAKQQSLVLDALPMCGTEQCVAVMVKQLKTSNSLSDTAKHTWYMSMAFVPVVTDKMIDSVGELVGTLHGKELLGIGSLVHTYCRNHEDCGADERVISLVEKLTSKLPAGCAVGDNNEEMEKVVVALKAIGNIGNVYSAVDKLTECANKKSNPSAVRVAAIQALRRMPCNDDKKDALFNIYSDKSDDIEERINAFLVVIQCNCRKTVRKVNKVLKHETVNQVGSFVWSYLKAKRHSKNPSDAALTAILLQEHISRRFDRDPNQFSRFYEYGDMSSSWNTGSSAESATIFEPGSYLPRSTSFNLTLHIFGHSVNLFELGGRQEGLDHLVDGLFGPEGLYSSPHNYHFNKNKKPSSTGRAAEILALQRNRKAYATSQRMSAQFSLKMFGDELAYFGWDQNKDAFDDLEKSTGRNWMKYLSEQRTVQLAKNFIFIDTTKTVPSLSGLPLRLTVTGASSVNIELGGKADMTKLLSPPHEMELKSIVKPSATIEISSTLAIQTAHFSSGYTQKARLHSSLASETEIKLEGGKVFKAIIRQPQKRQDLFHVDMQQFKTINNEHTPINQVAMPEGDYCTGSLMDRVFGIKVCVEAKSSPTDVPIYTAGVYMEKTDANLDTYELAIEAGEDFKPKSFSLNTPGSDTDREVRVDLNLEGETKVVNLRTPGKELKFEGKFSGSSNDAQAGELIMTVDNADVYEMNAEYKAIVEGGSRRLELDADYKSPSGGDPITVKAHVSTGNNAFMPEMKAVINGLDAKPYEYSAKAQVAKWTSKSKEFTAETLVKTPESEYKTDFIFDHAPEACHIKAELNGNRGGAADQFKWEMKSTTTKGTAGIESLSRKITLDKTFHPESNFEMTTVDTTAKKTTKRTCDLKYGEGLGKTGSMEMTTEQESPNKMSMTANAKLAEFNVDHNVAVDYDVDMPSKFFVKAKFDAPNNDKDADIVVSFSKPVGPKMDLDAEVKFNGGGTKFELSKNIKQKSDNEYTSATKISYDGKKLDVNADLTIHPEDASGNFEYKVTAKAQVTGIAEEFHFHKHAKYDSGKYTYVAHLKKADNALYDVHVTSGREGTKCDFDVKFKSDILEGANYRVVGDADDGNKQVAVKATLKHADKDYAKLELINPQSGSPSKHCKTFITWDLDTTAKSLLGEYNVENGNKHVVLAKSEYGGDAYEWKSTFDYSGNKYASENSMKKNGDDVVEINFKLEQGPQDDTGNFLLKTHAPLTERHLTGDLELKRKFKEGELDKKVKGEVKCHKSGKRAYIKVEDFTASDEGKHVQFDIGVGDIELTNKFKTSRGNDMLLEGEQKFQWAEGRAITRTFTASGDEDKREYKYEERMTTPFDVLKVYETTVVLNVVEKTFDSAIKWNDREMSLSGLLNRDEGSLTITPPSGNSITLSLENRHESIDDLDVHTQGGSIKWAGSNQLLIRYVSSSGSVTENQLFWEAKIADVTDVKARVDYKHDGASNIETKLMYKNADQTYQIAASVDTNAETGVVKIQTPRDDLQTAKISLQKEADGSYTIVTERNGESSSSISGKLDFSDGKRSANIKVVDIETPFAIEYEFDTSSSPIVEGHFKLIVTKDPDGANERYGISFLPFVQGPEDPAGKQISIIHPKRELQWRCQGLQRGGMRFDFNPDASKTDSSVTSLKVLPSEMKIEIKDPRLNHPLSLSVDGTRVAQKHNTWTLSLAYDALESKALKLIIEDEQGGAKSITISHDDSGLYQRYWLKSSDGRPSVSDVPSAIAAGVDYKHAGETKTLSFEYSREDYSSSLEFSSPNAQGKLAFEIVDVDGNREIRVLWYENKSKKPNWVVALVAQIEKMQYAVELRKAANGEVVLHASDRLVTDDTWESSIWHMEGKKRVDDIRAKLWLEDAQLLKFKLHVIPNGWKQVLKTITKFGKSDVFAGIQAAEGNFMSQMLESQKQPFTDVRTQVWGSIKPAMEGWESERIAMGKDFNTQGLMGSMQELCDVVVELYAIRLDLLELTIKDMTEGAGPTLKGVAREIAEAASGFRDIFTAMIEPVGGLYQALAELLQVSGAKLNQWKKNFDAALDDNKYLTDFFKYLKELSAKANEWLKNADFNNLSKTVSGFVGENANAYGVSLSAYKEYLDTVLEFSAVRGSYAAFQPMIDEIATVDLRDLVDRIFVYIRSVVGGQHWANALPRVTVYKPDQGKFEIELPLPYKANSLKELGSSFEPSRFEGMFKRTSKQLSELFSTSGSISDELWNKKTLYSPVNAELSRMGQAHTSVAFVLNDGERVDIITFDGHSYMVDRSCELLLANDFINGNFELFASFDETSKGLMEQKLRFEFRDKSIVIKHNGEVTLDGGAIELPYMEQNEFDDELFVSIKRLDHAIQLKTFDGVWVTFDWYYGMTTVQLAFNYHGHSSGLLGSNDNEHFNDLDLPNGDRNEDLNTFFDAYKTSDSCRVKEPIPSSESSVCADYFKMRDSSLRTCFRRVPPKSFFETCTDDNKCNVVASYVAACEIVGIDLVMPNECLSCEQPALRKKRHTYRSKHHGQSAGSKMTGGETKEVKVPATSAAKQADVIFVISESASQGYVAFSLAEFASEMASKLNAGGISDVKFGVVGFGGLGIHHEAHFHTGDNELLVSTGGLDKIISELLPTFASPFADASSVDALSAVHFVSTSFPFRAVSTKTIVLFKAEEDCGPNVDYYDVQTELLHRGIQLNVLGVEGILVDSPHDAELMGFDATTMYTTGGDSSELREALVTPHDACTVLAQETGGSVWTTADREATIFTVPAGKIGETVASTLSGGKCFECECDSVNLAPRTVCYPCEVPTPVSLSDKTFFNVPYIQLRNTIRKATKAVGVSDVL